MKNQTLEFQNSRRNILKMAGGSILAASGMASLASKQGIISQAPSGKRLGYAIVGIGKLSSEELIGAFKVCRLSKLVALVSGDSAKAKHIAEENGISAQNIYNYQNFDAIKNNPNIDVVYIVLPNNMHAEYTVRAAESGKHVLCEKPMANSAQECQSMIDACQKANRKLMIAYRCQYEPYNRSLINLVRSQELGKVKIINADNSQNIGDPNQWRLKKAMAGGGPLPDVGIYCLSAYRYLTGEEPIEVFGTNYTTPGDPRDLV
jgi:predicted dehydrogenase